ncbi:MAG: hypothetical protein IPK16_17225 [Anaerolineales bacterium]|nr:hypothetical protein [Anaerolineales bacterium]
MIAAQQEDACHFHMEFGSDLFHRIGQNLSFVALIRQSRRKSAEHRHAIDKFLRLLHLQLEESGASYDHGNVVEHGEDQCLFKVGELGCIRTVERGDGDPAVNRIGTLIAH